MGEPLTMFGWTVFPIGFIVAATGLGLLGAAAEANLLYLALDIYTKIV